MILFLVGLVVGIVAGVIVESLSRIGYLWPAIIFLIIAGTVLTSLGI